MITHYNCFKRRNSQFQMIDEESFPEYVEYEGEKYYLNDIEKDETKYPVTLSSIPGRIVSAKRQTQAMFTRANTSSPWNLLSETTLSWTEFTYWNGYDAYYEITSVTYAPRSDIDSTIVIKFENRTYHYYPY